MHRVNKRCEACGQLLPAPPARFPSVTGYVRRSVVDLIADNPGITAQEIRSRVRSDGNSESLIHIMICQARKQIGRDGYRIESSRQRGTGYWIVPLVGERESNTTPMAVQWRDSNLTFPHD